jgi:hypothetical protein
MIECECLRRSVAELVRELRGSPCGGLDGGGKDITDFVGLQDIERRCSGATFRGDLLPQY